MSSHANQLSETRKPLQLPRLPVPDLSKTLTKYLASLEPLLQEESLRTGVPYEQAYALRAKWTESFSNGVGKVCQERLKALDKASPDNWLDDNFWLKGYLEWRAPLLINSNWWLVFCDDKQGSVSSTKLGFTNWQLRRAAWLTHRILEFKAKIDGQELYPDTTRTGIWLRESVYKMFNVSRIPQKDCDILSSPPPPDDLLSQYVIVIANNWFYALRVHKPSVGLLPASKILERMTAIARDASTRGKGPMIGALSADDRNSWAENLSYLLSLTSKNERIHQTIVRSLFSVSLDSETHVLSERVHHSALASSKEPQSKSQLSIDAHLHSIRSVPSNVSNRFFDKAATVIVDPAGQAGMMGEHSPCDAMVPSIVGEYALVQSVPEDFGIDVDINAKSEDVDPEARMEGDSWYRLDWVTDPRVLSSCADAKKRADSVMANSDNSLLWFDDFGGDWIKSLGLSPDAFVQLALQLAWFRTHPNENRFTATYETVLTRMFHKGRTETIRSLTADSRRWVLGMEDLSMSPQSKHTLFLRALQTHRSLTREAMTGRGIDRHLLGLQNMLKPDGKSDQQRDGDSETGTELFTDPLFWKSQQWRLSTSGLNAGLLFKGTGFGTVFEDGYGINYLVGPSMIKFGIESKFSGRDTSTKGFQTAIVGSLRDMHALCVDKGLSDVKGKL